MLNLQELTKPSYSGKVKDVYDLGDQLILVASDRLSAFDVVFDQKILEKGKILTQISNHWFSLLDFVPNHIIESNIENFPEPYSKILPWKDRAVIVHKTKRIDFECVVRGYLFGSALKEYKANNLVAGQKLPQNLKAGVKLAHPIFTPATKIDIGHDENVSFDFMEHSLGSDIATKLRDFSLQIFKFASDLLEKRGFLLLDTKFEFGMLNGEILLIDEVLTPDSSRFALKAEYENAMAKNEQVPAFDKQIIRNFLENFKWNKKPPAPKIPEEIIQKTLLRYSKIKKEVLCITLER